MLKVVYKRIFLPLFLFWFAFGTPISLHAEEVIGAVETATEAVIETVTEVLTIPEDPQNIIPEETPPLVAEELISEEPIGTEVITEAIEDLVPDVEVATSTQEIIEDVSTSTPEIIIEDVATSTTSDLTSDSAKATPDKQSSPSQGEGGDRNC